MYVSMCMDVAGRPLQNNTHHSKEILNGRGQAGRGLLMLILSVIYCHADKAVCEDQLFKKLHDHVDKRVRTTLIRCTLYTCV